MRKPLALYGVVLCVVFLVSVLSAQDAVKVDPAHYSVIRKFTSADFEVALWTAREVRDAQPPKCGRDFPH